MTKNLATGQEELVKQIAKGRRLSRRWVNNPEDLAELSSKATTWHEYCRDFLLIHFPNEDIGRFLIPKFRWNEDVDAKLDELRSNILRTIQKLESAKERLPLFEVKASVAWIPERLHRYLKGSMKHARETNEPTDWGNVTSAAVRFLEDEIRTRTNLDAEKASGREVLAVKAFNPDGGVFNLQNKAASVQKGWMHFVQGLFLAVANPAAHTVRQHSESYAMGIVGAVTMVLVMLDEEVGPPSS